MGDSRSFDPGGRGVLALWQLENDSHVSPNGPPQLLQSFSNHRQAQTQVEVSLCIPITLHNVLYSHCILLGHTHLQLYMCSSKKQYGSACTVQQPQTCAINHEAVIKTTSAFHMEPTKEFFIPFFISFNIFFFKCTLWGQSVNSSKIH